MAKLVESAQGRRMISLSTEDVLTVVSLYQQHLLELQSLLHDDATQPPTK